MPFMKKVISSMKENGQIIFATNEDFFKKECIEYMTETLAATWEATVVVSPPYDEVPQAITLPSSFTAAKAQLLE